jgi:hypothetical protein
MREFWEVQKIVAGIIVTALFWGGIILAVMSGLGYNK